MRFLASFKTSRLLCASCVWLCCASAHAQTDKAHIVVPAWGYGQNSPDDYFYRLLTLALSKTESNYGAADVVPSATVLTATRVMADIKSNKTIDVMWHSNSTTYARDLLAVPISLTKELNEYRVLLIRKEDQARFSAVQTLEDLASLTAGSGADWSSREVMLANGLPVISVTNTALLFNMLKAKRFDYVSRSLFEIWGESEHFAKDGLSIEKSLLIYGGEPFYFFVNKNNTALARRIEEGLRSAMADGSFEELFYSDEGMRLGQQELEHHERVLLKLKHQARPGKSLP